MPELVKRAEPSSAAGSRAVVVLLLLYALSLIDRQILNLMVDPIRRDLGISQVQIGFLQGFAFATFYTLCGMPLGWAADRYNRRLLIFGGVIVWALATTACGLANSYVELLVARFAVGAGEAALLPAAYSILSDLFRRERLTQAMSLFSIGAMIGSGTALAVGGLVVAYAASGGIMAVPWLGHVRPWQFVFLIIGLPGLVMAFLVFLFPEPIRYHPPSKHRSGERLMPFLRERTMLLACHFGGFSLIYLVSSGASAWAPTYLSRTFGLPIGQIGLAYGAMTLLFGVIGFLGSGRIVGLAFARGVRDAHFRYPAIGALLLAANGALATIVPWPWLSILLFGANGLFTTVAAVSAASLQLVAPPHLRGRVSALFLVVFNMLGAGLGPLAVAFAAEHVTGNEAGLGPAMRLVFLIFSLLAAALLFAGMRRLRDQFETG